VKAKAAARRRAKPQAAPQAGVEAQKNAWQQSSEVKQIIESLEDE